MKSKKLGLIHYLIVGSMAFAVLSTWIMLSMMIEYEKQIYSNTVTQYESYKKEYVPTYTEILEGAKYDADKRMFTPPK